MIFKMLDTIFDFRKNKFFMIFQSFKIPPPCPPGGRIWTNMQRAQQGPPMVHMTKFDQIRLKDLGARRVDDTHTHTQARIAEISKSISSLNIDRIESNFLHNV